MVSDSVRVDDVEDSLARNDKTVAESLTTVLGFWILALIVAGEVANNVRVWRLGKDEIRGVVGFELLHSACEIR